MKIEKNYAKIVDIFGDRDVKHKKPRGSLVARVAPNLEEIYRCP